MKKTQYLMNYLINKNNVAVSEISYKSIPTAHVASEMTVLRHISNQQVTQSVSDNHHQIVIIMTHVIYEFDNYYESSLDRQNHLNFSNQNRQIAQ